MKAAAAASSHALPGLTDLPDLIHCGLLLYFLQAVLVRGLKPFCHAVELELMQLGSKRCATWVRPGASNAAALQPFDSQLFCRCGFFQRDSRMRPKFCNQSCLMSLQPQREAHGLLYAGSGPHDPCQEVRLPPLPGAEQVSAQWLPRVGWGQLMQRAMVGEQRCSPTLLIISALNVGMPVAELRSTEVLKQRHAHALNWPHMTSYEPTLMPAGAPARPPPRCASSWRRSRPLLMAAMCPRRCTRSSAALSLRNPCQGFATQVGPEGLRSRLPAAVTT
jgi:hypothetical protein